METLVIYHHIKNSGMNHNISNDTMLGSSPSSLYPMGATAQIVNLAPGEMSSSSLQGNGSDTLVWETCLRRVVFTSKFLKQSLCSETYTRYEDEKALQFLLELLCGLHSKILGETEIFGQFKIFLEKNILESQEQFISRNHLQFIIKEVKDLRQNFVRHFGQKSYGSRIRKIVQQELAIPGGQVIDIIGVGQLSEKMAPYLENYQLRFHVRNQRSQLFGESLASGKYPHQMVLTGQIQSPEILIISAPISNEQLRETMSGLMKTSVVIDLRSTTEKESVTIDLLSSQVKYYDLEDLFRSLSEEQEKAEKLLVQVKKEISARVSQHLNRSFHRPSGWEDLCG